ncbi:unnamed protein product [Citrullus colocynthis]|uniref:Uncharacterized protein n=1 Tax=Citrullus colocynthis TaxID=252529 RepID=A0ABP0YUZ4_9ROSI
MASKTSLLLLQLSLLAAGVVSEDVIFHFENQCPYSIWISSNSPIGDADPERPRNTLEIFNMPDTWTGSLWARPHQMLQRPRLSFLLPNRRLRVRHHLLRLLSTGSPGHPPQLRHQQLRRPLPPQPHPPLQHSRPDPAPRRPPRTRWLRPFPHCRLRPRLVQCLPVVSRLNEQGRRVRRLL